MNGWTGWRPCAGCCPRCGAATRWRTGAWGSGERPSATSVSTRRAWWWGAASDRVVDIAVRHADGWDGPGEDPDRYAEVAGRTRARAEAVGRQEPLTLEAQVFLGDVGIQALRGHLRRLGDAGAERATVVLHRERGPDWVWRVADAVL